MIRRTVLAVALAFVVGVPRPASAQSVHTWDYLCMLGSQQACVTFSLALAYDPAPGTLASSIVFNEGLTRATLSVTHLQGMAAVPSVPAWQLTQFGVSGFNTTWTTPYPSMTAWERFFLDGQGSLGIGSMTTSQPVHLVQSGTTFGPWGWEGGGWREGAFGATTSAITFAEGHFWGGFYGCDLPTAGIEYAAWFGGCGTTVTGSILLPGNWTLGVNVTPSFAGTFGGMGEQAAQFRCQIGTNCAQVNVPEPGSLLLFASGGLGLLGVGWRRRRDRAV